MSRIDEARIDRLYDLLRREKDGGNVPPLTGGNFPLEPPL